MAESRPRFTDTGDWVLRIGIACFYVLVGLEKFGGGSHTWIPVFERIGWGQWFRIATGVIEVGGGVRYVLPWTKWPATILLAATMLGAVLAHVTVLHDPGSSIIPIVALIGTVVVALRDREPNLTPTVRRPRGS